MNATVAALSLCLVGVGLCGCSTGTSALSRTGEQLRTANYFQAYRVLQAEIARGADVDEAQIRAVQVGYLLELGQDQVFDNDEHDAIQTFREVLALEPDNATAKEWIDKSIRKLAARAAHDGDEHVRSGQLEEALEAYHLATTYIEDYPPSLAGVRRVAEVYQRRREDAENQYTKGVAALGERLWGTTWYHMVNAVQLDPEHERAQRSRDLASKRLIRERYDRAIELQDQGFFGAALSEFKTLRATAPDVDGIDARIEHMQREVEAQRLVREAEMKAFKRQYEGARTLLEEAFEVTVSQQAEIGDLLILVKERDLTDRYAEARIFELEGRLEDALGAYAKIDEAWPGFKDVKMLMSSIESTLEVASEAYQRGEKAEMANDLESAIDAYEEAQLVYPTYKDVETKLRQLRAKRSRRS